jgi:hypothetical protein
MFFLKEEPSPVYHCRLGNLCPWCYARSHYELIDLVFAGLVEHGLALAIEKAWVPASPPADLVERLGVRAEDLQQLVRAQRNTTAGAFWSVTAEPSEQNDRPGWLFRSRLLAAKNHGEPLHLVPAGWKVVERPNPTLEDAQGLLAAALRYPTGLLRGPAEAALQCLLAREGQRLRASYGVFRKPYGVKS